MSLQMHAGPPPAHGDCILDEDVASRPDLKEQLIDRYAGLLNDRGWVIGGELNWLHLCLEETLVNAMVHGNEGDPDLSVNVTIWDDGDSWELVVRDRGDGFSPDEVPDPADPDALLFEHGRGILLMQDWLDELRYHDDGATAVLRRRKQRTQE